MYEWEEGMDEISGFGGSYEEGCRKMVKAGVEETRDKLAVKFAQNFAKKAKQRRRKR